MGVYKFGLILLLCSHQLFASSYWSHVPGFGSVQLTELDPQAAPNAVCTFEVE